MERTGSADWSERSAKLAFWMLGIHTLTLWAGLSWEEERAWLRLALLAAYALCLWQLDRALWHLGSRRAARSLSGYWLAATLCAGAWLIWGEQWLGGCGDIVLVLLSAAILPYGQIFSRYYGGWPWENSGLTAAVGAAAVLFWCLAHLLWYVRLSRRGSAP